MNFIAKMCFWLDDNLSRWHWFLIGIIVGMTLGCWIIWPAVQW